MDEGQPPFTSLAIVGLGLIGGSLALATRERWPSMRVTGVDDDAVIAHVRGSGAIDRSAASLTDVREADLVVLAAPVRQNLALLQDVRVAGAAVVTDVGSTKRVMVERARALPSPLVFIGGHPLGGAERGGFAFARPDLFEGRPWIFTPEGAEQREGDPLARLRRFVEGLGARPVTMDAVEHDRVMALLSHLPQLTASALMEVVGQAAGAGRQPLAGRGLTDTTRLAASPANVWRDVCQTNAGPIAEALDLLIARLTDLRANLGREETVDRLFDEAGRWRSLLVRDRP